MFTAAKDAMASKAALLFLNKEIARYGTVTDLRIDSRNKTVDFSCQLLGEVSPVSIHVEDYSVETEGGKHYIQASSFRCSRPWLESVLADYGRNRRLELPPMAAGILR